MFRLLTAVILCTAFSCRSHAQTDVSLRIGNGITPPRITQKSDPQYSKEARIAKVSGTALCMVVVGADGSVKEFKIVRGVGFGLDEMTEQAVRQWQFAPGTKDGVPVSVVANIEVNFRLLDKGDRTNVGPDSLIFSLDPDVTRPELIKAPAKFKDPGHDDDPVVLEIEVDSDGNCQVLNAISGAQDDVDAVTKYVNNWRFSPAQLNGNPKMVHGRLHFLMGLPETYRSAKPASPPPAPLP